MRVELRVKGLFEAAHSMVNLPEEHRCHRLHGHRYEVEVAVEGEVDATGILIEYERIQGALGRVLAPIDHTFLNDHTELEVSSTERLCAWLWKSLGRVDPRVGELLCEVRVQESVETCCVYRGR